ncbi:gibberellin 2-beta-dioxygenase 8-like [Tripterygium wilfordii]|uniref:gibberellin 2-beta-dioxygenase 8-like n=1 Tax=Tripterygium wilfordii TaxID=458696 RepID=UPI0018F80DD4|nr:gibberellin 2-beta-dioxygenase 8-like [Tripterygium wilfordii]
MFRFSLEEFTDTVAKLAERISVILSASFGVESSFFQENCPTGCSYLRLNRYPPCPVSSKVYGFIPHTDSGILTIVYQDGVGGLQLMKDGRWFSVKPNPTALIVNVGDLLEALSNGVYRSIRHRVLAPGGVERLSLAYFYCPSFDAVIQSCSEPPKYKKFSFGEYMLQIGKDVRATGDKVGLSRFLNVL